LPVVRDRNAAVETVFAALTSARFFSLFLLFQIPALPAFALAAVPLGRVTHRHGLGKGILGTLVSIGLVAAIGAASGGVADAQNDGLLAALAIGFPMLAVGLRRRGVSSSTAFLTLALAGSIALVGVLLVEEHAFGRPVAGRIAMIFDAITPATGADTVKGVDPETAARLAATMTRFRNFALAYWPGLASAFWILSSAMAFYAAAFTARPQPSADETRFEQLRAPAAAVGLFVASGAGFALLPQPARAVAGDLLVPLLALYFLTGLSIICHFARRWFRARILRAGLYALVVYFPLNVGVGLLGLFDWYADFRRRGEKA
jgi:uncharacterized membrane protein YqaE (UPF0057 family)